MRRHLFSLLMSAVLLCGCGKDDGGGDGGGKLTIPDQSEKTQQAFADEETTGGFTFTAASSWRASVRETTPQRSSVAVRSVTGSEEVRLRGRVTDPSRHPMPFARFMERGRRTGVLSAAPRPAVAETRAMAAVAAISDRVPWLRLLLDGRETYSGGAGKITLVIELEPNYSGQTRSAVITIVCGGEKIAISVEQDAKTESGIVPDNPSPVTSIEIDRTALTLEAGQSATLSAIVLPVDAAVKSLSWSSSKPSVATVDAVTGKVTAVSVGETVVTAVSTSDPEISASCMVTVTDGDDPSPIVPARRVARMVTSGDYEGGGSWEDVVSFIYDSEGRVIALHNEGYRDYDDGKYEDWDQTYDYTYTSSSVDMSSAWADGAYRENEHTVATLDVSGKITAIESLDESVSIDDNGEEGWTERYRFEGTASYSDGYLSGFRSTHIWEDGSPEDIDRTEHHEEQALVWKDGNLRRADKRVTFEGGGADNEYALFTYSDAENTPNLDLNMFFMQSDAGLICYGDGDFFQSFDLMGKRSRNMVASETCYDEPGSTMPDGNPYPPYEYRLEWRYDEQGYPVSVTVTRLERTEVFYIYYE